MCGWVAHLVYLAPLHGAEPGGHNSSHSLVWLNGIRDVHLLPGNLRASTPTRQSDADNCQPHELLACRPTQRTPRVNTENMEYVPV